ncbi:MAG: AbrB/MazE/SpoVT family DNA-binding domain-containing protein [Thermoplasmatales archaeon]|nr:AbrB/MazE/SpoVT family DNA-binding domain-containing protein [Thermoplasmatales archaeon]
MDTKSEIIDISRTSKSGESLRITLPKRIAEKLSIKEGEFVGFYVEGDKVIVERIT